MPKRERILLVEDDCPTATALKKLLEIAGFETRVAGGCLEAKEIADAEAFDLLLCDVGFSDGDGCDLMKQLREMYHLDGIAMTGYGQPRDIERCMEAGFARHLLKPVPFPKLEDAINEVLAGRRARATSPPPAADPFHFFG